MLTFSSFSLHCGYPADQAWPLVENDLNWFIEHGNGKKMYFDEVSTAFRHHHHPPILELTNSVDATERLAISDLRRRTAEQPKRRRGYPE